MDEKKAVEYYQAAEQSVHVFFLWFLEKVCAEVSKKGRKFGYCSFLTSMLQDLDVIAAASKAKKLEVYKDIVPIEGVTFTQNDEPVQAGCKDVLYEFKSLSPKPVYLGTLTMINTSQSGMSQSAMSFMLAENAEEATLALTNYHGVRKDLCRQRSQVANFAGDRYESFQNVKWADIALPSGMAKKIENEIADFFKADETYGKHGLRHRRGMLFVGPRGNGKTIACQAIGTNVSVPVIYGWALQTTSEDVHTMLTRAIGYNAPCVVIVEDLDALLLASDESEAILNLLYLLEKVASMDGVFLVSTVNSENFDTTLFRPGLFDSFYFFPNPAENERKRMFQRMLRGKWNKIPKEAREDLIARLDGKSGAILQEVVSRAILASKGSPSAKHLLAAADEVVSVSATGNPIGY